MAYIDTDRLNGFSEKYTKDKKVFLELIQECMVQVEATLKYHIERCGMNKTQISVLTGIEKSRLSKITLDNGKLFILPHRHLQSFCTKVAKCSATELLLGERRKIYLPKDLALIADVSEKIVNLSKTTAMKMQRDLIRRYSRSEVSLSSFEAPPELFLDRLNMLAADKGIPANDLFTPDKYRADMPYKRADPSFMISMSRAVFGAEMPGYVPTRVIVIAALFLNVSADFLICEDFTQTAPDDIYYIDKNGEEVKVQSDITLSVLSSCLRLPIDKRTELIAYALCQYGS